MTKSSANSSVKSTKVAAAKRQSQAPATKKQGPASHPSKVMQKPNAPRKEGKKEKEVSRAVSGESAVLTMATLSDTRQKVQVDRNLDPNAMGAVVLAFAGYIAKFSLSLTQAQINKLLGTLMDDLARGMQGYVSLFSRAPKVWWEVRQKVKPCSAKYSYAFDGIVTTVTYPSADSGWILGIQAQQSTATPAASTLYSAIDATNADYDYTQELFGVADKELKLMADPYMDSNNTDPSAYSFYSREDIASICFGQVIDVNATKLYPLDYSRRLEVRPRTRWACGLQLCSTDASDLLPTPNTILTAPMITEVGHRLLCDATGAPDDVRNALPVCVPVSLSDLVNRTITGFNFALKSGGMADGGLTSIGVYPFAAYMIGAILEWFGAWSIVAPPYMRWSGANKLMYNSTCGCSTANSWKGSPLPAALALNLSYLTPCFDANRKRIYYPVLALDCNPSSFTATGSGWVFSATGVAPWTDYFTKQFSTYYDTVGTCQSVLAQYASQFPIRTFPKVVAGYSSSCTQIAPLNGNTPLVALGSHKPSQDELELFNLFVFPRIFPATVGQFLEFNRYLRPFYYTPVINYGNALSYQSFAILNNNMLSTAARQFLDNFDQQQEKGSGTGWISSLLTAGAGATAARYAPQIGKATANVADVTAMYWLTRKYKQQ